ncbi:MAG: transglutaminase family protein [Chthoniobacteraceae bacterium]
MDYRITHRTIYEYAEGVTVSHHAARLAPMTGAMQRTSRVSLSISPVPSVRKDSRDYFGNHVCFFAIQEIHRHLEVVVNSYVTVDTATVPVLTLSPPWEEVAACFRDPVLPADVAPYEFCLDSPLVRLTPEYAAYARESFTAGTPLLVGARDLMRRIREDFRYDSVATTTSTPLDEVWRKRHGVCQDFAHMGIACIRSLGLPARYVSGYLRTYPAEGKPRMVGADASHAWFSVYCPGTGWVDFDPTNDLIPTDEHITVAIGRDFSDVSPLSGILTGGGEHEVRVSVDVEPYD